MTLWRTVAKLWCINFVQLFLEHPVYIPRLSWPLNITYTQRTRQVLGQCCWNNGHRIDWRQPEANIRIHKWQIQLEYCCRWRTSMPAASDSEWYKVIQVNWFICSAATVHQLLNTNNIHLSFTITTEKCYLTSGHVQALNHSNLQSSKESITKASQATLASKDRSINTPCPKISDTPTDKLV